MEKEIHVSEDTQLRFYLAAQLMKLPYGRSTAIDVVKAHKAWPPTGDADRSLEGAIRALALASGGNRPETTYTTEQRILNDLDDTFEVHMHPSGLDWIISRKATACPHCHGSGWVNVEQESEVPDVFDHDEIPLSEKAGVMRFRRERCTHRPKA